MAVKPRLDQLLVAKGLAPSRQHARALIMAGKVMVDTQCKDKPGMKFDPQVHIDIRGEGLRYVSRGGLKLEGGLRALQLDVNGMICMDVGASTGGFTDCLLQYGAGKVYAVDVGYGQLAWKLRQDPRVIVIERTNVRHMPPGTIPESVDLITIDTSFISLRIVVPAVRDYLKPEGRILALIKPQFEVGKGKVGKGGVVRDPDQQQAVIDQLTAHFAGQGLQCGPVVPSPVRGPKGNQEYLLLLVASDSAL